MDGKQVNRTQLIWAIVLILAGLGVFLRIPQVMPRIEQFHRFAEASGFIRFCFYMLGILLIAGGCKKLYRLFRQ
jgi:Ni,Fe-hydrogenase I cytochrome b subunit